MRKINNSVNAATRRVEIRARDICLCFGHYVSRGLQLNQILSLYQNAPISWYILIYIHWCVYGDASIELRSLNFWHYPLHHVIFMNETKDRLFVWFTFLLHVLFKRCKKTHGNQRINQFIEFRLIEK